MITLATSEPPDDGSRWSVRHLAKASGVSARTVRRILAEGGEKTQIQALDRRHPELPMRVGSDRRPTTTYERHRITRLLAAVAAHSGEVSWRCVERNDHTAFLCFVEGLCSANPRGELDVILEGPSVHKHDHVLDWAARRRRLTLHFTPTYASWLNQVEIRFSIFALDVLRDAVWHSKTELVAQIRKHIRAEDHARDHRRLEAADLGH